MHMRNDIGIGIDIFPPNKNPSLYVYNKKLNTVYKVATFSSESSVQLFKQAVSIFLKGVISHDK